MSEVCGKLRDEVQMPGLAWGVLVSLGLQGVREWLVIHQDVKIPTFHEVTKVTDSQVYSQ